MTVNRVWLLLFFSLMRYSPGIRSKLASDGQSSGLGPGHHFHYYYHHQYHYHYHQVCPEHLLVSHELLPLLLHCALHLQQNVAVK